MVYLFSIGPYPLPSVSLRIRYSLLIPSYFTAYSELEASWNVMAHAQIPDFVPVCSALEWDYYASLIQVLFGWISLCLYVICRVPQMFSRFGRRASVWNIYSHFLLGDKWCLVDMALLSSVLVRPRLKCDGTRADTRLRPWAKRTSPFKSAGASVHSTAGSRGVRISGSNAGYTMFRVSVKGTGYPFHSPDSPSLPLPCVTVCHHISTGVHRQRHLTKYN